MKWPSSNGNGGGGGGMVSGGSGTVAEPVLVDAGGVAGTAISQAQQRSQDDAAVGYVFQRPPDPEFPLYGPKQARWALGDDSIIDNHDKWKYTVPTKMTPEAQLAATSIGLYDPSAMLQQTLGVNIGKQPQTPQQPLNQAQQQQLSQAQQQLAQQLTPEQQQQLIYHMAPPHGLGLPLGLHQQYVQNCMAPPPLQPQQQQQQLAPSQHMQIASSAKKLWGLEGGVSGMKDGGKGLTLQHLHAHEQVWRDSTWSTTTDHAVSQPLTMVSRRPTGGGAFPGGGVDSSNILSPRGSDSTGGLGVKMVEYVLGTSPTSKDSLVSLEPRMRGLGLNDNTTDKDKDKAPPSPFDPKDSIRKEQENGVVMQNGGGPIQNGVVQVLQDEEKGFNRTPGSRQPSPAEEELSKNLQHSQVVILKQAGVEHEALQAPPGHQQSLAPFPGALHNVVAAHHAALNVSHPSQHPGLTLADSVNQQFDHVLSLDQVTGVQSGVNPYEAVSYSQAAPPHQSQPDANTTAVLQQQHNFDVQQLFRSQAAQSQAAAQTLAQPTAAQLQLLQQQQYLAAAAAQQAAAPPPGAAFAQPPYVLNPAQHGADAAAAAGAPYVPTLITSGVPQYYGVAAPWGVYSANIIPQNAGSAPRRPLSPSGQENVAAAAAASTALQAGSYLVPYYDQNGQLLMAQGPMRNGAPMRLVSPAPVLVPQQASRQTPATASLYSGTPGLYGTNVNTSAVNGGSLGGLGLSTGSTGRRDSFDRNTSAFSPSLEYRPKWPANYNLGSSPSPLTGSLTPPPSGSLQLGGLVNSRVMSAAPGAETKYRTNSIAAGLTTNTMFGSTSSLFTKLNSTRNNLTTVATTALDKPAGRSRLLEDFRNNRFPNLQLRDLAHHIVEFSQDQHGSRFIQQKLERATVAEKQLVFNEILSAAYNLMTDVFGNYVIQKFFEFGTAEQKTTLAQKVRGHVLPLALQMYGCRVIQKALESIPPEHQQEIVRELDGHVLKCVKDQNGNHVVQKCIECVEPAALQFIIKSFVGQVFALSTHPYGCRVIQRVLEHCTPEQTAPLLAELHAHTDQLIQDQFGNYVIQHVLEHGKPEDKSQLIAGVRGKVLTLSTHKFASNVVEKCVTHATRAERAMLIEEVCNFNDNALHVMMKDQYANYVVQKMIDVSEPTQRKILMHKIRPHLNSLRKYTYGKHIIAKLEKFFMKTANAMSAIGNELGPIGPPSNGVM